MNVLYAAQYFMLGSVAGGINNIVSLAKYIFFAHNAKKGKENTKASILFFCALSIVLGIPAISGWHTFIPLITSLLFTYAIWQENPIVLRIIAMICNVLWVIFNFQVQAYVSMVYSIFEFIVAFITLILIIRNYSLHRLNMRMQQEQNRMEWQHQRKRDWQLSERPC